MSKSILMIAPFLTGALRGNAVHAERKAGILTDAGYQVRLIDGSQELPDDLQKPDLLIALHGWRTAKRVDQVLARWDLPFALVTTGTDVPPGLDKSHRETANANYQRANAIITQHPEQIRELERAFPETPIRSKAHHVPPSVIAPERLEVKELGAAPKLLHISGIRPIKGVGFIPEFMGALWKRIPDAGYTLLGAAIESDYARPVLDWIASSEGAQQLEGLDHDQSLAILRKSDLLVSTSRHEGLSNALLEAMAWGTPVVATNIAPNRELIEDRVTGLLYDGKAGFVKAIERLLSDQELYQSIAQAAYQKVTRSHAPAIEQAALQRVIGGLMH